MTRTKSPFLCMAFAASIVCAGGCGSKEKMPYLGKWNGAMEPDSVQNSRFKKEAFRMSGYLQVYATGDKYKMRLEGPQQAIEVTGTWILKQKTMLMTPADVKIDDFGGENLRNPNQPYLPNEDVKRAFGAPIPFRLSRDLQTATSTTLEIGPVNASLIFQKGNLGK